ncbi:methionyl-tRNA formyltransferase [Quadrisphaera oryzae]|uniref:methionyl-tRNA formyltransferase n=1 Tax=Quadrisphaera TaxID=317661 RepID=UPI001646BD3E|nr:methionyl-tRNA formyltransferase [Quadrisphaera sp. RL12-1S]MBC3763781.1 methionyl-tRNA formyltransferase [Quadrisphaera sp. RL12-1S]
MSSTGSRARRVVVAGSHSPAVAALNMVLERVPAEDVLVIAPAGGRTHSWHDSLETAAVFRGVRATAPEDVNSPRVVEALAEHEPDLVLSVYYNQIFGREFLSVARGRVVNLHPSLLPRHRGTAPLIWAIAEGDLKTGVTLHHVDTGVDTGAVIRQASIPIHLDDTGFDLHQKVSRLASGMLAAFLRDFFEHGTVPEGRPQSGVPSLHRRRDAHLNHLDWSESSDRLRNVVRALSHPLDGAHTYAEERRIGIERLRPVEHHHDLTSKRPGVVETPPGAAPLVWCSTGLLRVDLWRADDGSVRPGAELALSLREGTALS